MTSILEEFVVFKSVDQKLKNEIKLFNVIKGGVNSRNSAFFVTKDDQVHSLGMNKCGILGLGYSDEEFYSESHLIEELCDKNICEFYFSNNALSIFARSQSGQIFAWGSNYCQNIGQTSNELVKYLKPRRIEFFDDKKIIKISSSISNYLALTSNGTVYKFNDDIWAENEAQHLPCPILLDSNQGICHKIKSIQSSVSFALAISGEDIVYHCGNFAVDFYHKKGIDTISLVTENGDEIISKKIVASGFFMFILDEQGFVYYSQGVHPELKFYRVVTMLKFVDIFCDENQLLCQTDEWVYVFQIGKPLIKAKYINFFDYYLGEYQATTNTVNIDQDGYLSIRDYIMNQDSTIDYFLLKKISHIYNVPNKYQDQFKEIKHLGSGGYGTVKLVNKNNENNKQYAIKKIWMDREVDKNQIFKEIRFMSKMDSNYIPKIITAWIEKSQESFAYIQMENCPDSLENLIQNKPRAFERLPEEPMDSLEFFISCEMLRELTECLAHLHSFENSFIKQSDVLMRTLNHKMFFVSNGSEGRYLKLADLGLISIFDGMIQDSMLGTLGYMAPEVYNGYYDLKADIYSLGKIGLELFNVDLQQLDQVLEYPRDYFNFNKLIQLLMQMIDPMPCERPSCKEILENLQAISNRTQLRKTDIGIQLSKLDKSEKKFFVHFYQAKIAEEPIIRSHLSNIEPESIESTSNQDQYKFEPDASVTSGMTENFQQLMRLVNNGITDQNLDSIMMKMTITTLQTVQSGLGEIFEMLFNCFEQSNGVITENGRKITTILEKNSAILLGTKQLFLRLQHDKLIADRIGWDNYAGWDSEDHPPILMLKPIKPEEKAEDMPQISDNFETIWVSTGNSAIFNAISYCLFKSEEYSRIIRYLTFFKYFENRKYFKPYCKEIGEDYSLTLLKIVASADEIAIKAQNKFPGYDFTISSEISAILAIQLAVLRPINILAGPPNDEYHQFCINGVSNNILGQNVVENPLWISNVENGFLVIEPKRLHDLFIPSQFIPGDHHMDIFSDIKSKVEPHFQPVVGTFGLAGQEGLGRLYNHVINNNQANTPINEILITSDSMIFISHAQYTTEELD